MSLSQSCVRNALLSAMTAADYSAIESHLVRVALPVRLAFQDAGQPIAWIYFPEDGIVSVVSTASDGRYVEVGIFGREGMSGTAVVLGADQSPHDVYMQVEGVSGLRLSVINLQRAMADSSTLQALLLRYVQTVMIQSASSTTAAAGYTIQQRLARWLLMCHDRVEGDEIKLTHEFISMMLATRRAGVSVAVQALEDRQLIVAKRRRIIVIDREALRDLAGSSYGVAEAEYVRLMKMPLDACRQDVNHFEQELSAASAMT